MTFDPKEKIRNLFIKQSSLAQPVEEDPQVLKYAERIEEMFQGIVPELALKMARETVNNHVRRI